MLGPLSVPTLSSSPVWVTPAEVDLEEKAALGLTAESPVSPSAVTQSIARPLVSGAQSTEPIRPITGKIASISNEAVVPKVAIRTGSR